MGSGKRNEVWDIAKGLGILFVVAGHGFQGDISKFVNLFHIPLFFFASGLVFKFKDRSMKSIGTFLYKCLKSLWLPSVLYGCFYVLTHNLFTHIGLYDLNDYSLRQSGIAIVKHLAFMKTEPLESAMWFLTAIFIGRCLLYAVLWISSFFADRKKTIIEIVLIALIFAMGCLFFYRGIGLPGNADNACSLLPFMYAGYRMKKVEFKRPYLAIPSAALMIILLVVTGQTLRMSRNELVNPAFLLIAGTLGILFTFEISALMKKWEPGLRYFSYIGQNTIPILCLHLLAFRLVSFIWIQCDGLPISMLAKHPVVAGSYFWGVLYTIAGLTLSLIVPVVKKRIKTQEGQNHG